MHKRDDILVILSFGCLFVCLFSTQAQYAEDLNTWAADEKSKGHTTPQVQCCACLCLPRALSSSQLLCVQSDEPQIPDVTNVWYRGVRDNLTESNPR
jgi:hypothetical protein